MKLFKLFCIEVHMDFSFIFLFLLLIFTYVGFFKEQGFSLWTSALLSTAASVLLFVSVVMHEFGHMLAGKRLGLEVKSITLFIFGGRAEMTDIGAATKKELIMALSGPAVTLALIGVFWGSSLAMAWFGFGGLESVCMFLFTINLALLIFNLMPGFPLDGGRVLRSLMAMGGKKPLKATKIAGIFGRVFGMMVISLGVLNALLNSNLIGGVFTVAVGYFLMNAGRHEYEYMKVKTILSGKTVREVMMTAPTMHEGGTREELFALTLVRGVRHYPVVDGSGKLEGMVHSDEAKRADYRSLPIVGTRIPKSLLVSPDEDAFEASKKFAYGQNLFVVDDGGFLAGEFNIQSLKTALQMTTEEDLERLDQRVTV